jgi:hypothetical protein
MHLCAIFPKFKNFIFAIVLIVCAVAIDVEAQNDEIKIPANVKPFVEKGKIPIALETGDLNGDGRKDMVLVISEIVREDASWEEGAAERSVLILIAEADGTLRLAGRNDLVVLCRNCGGVFGDPFAGVDVKGSTFTVNNYGGSNDRWSYSYTFAYSRRDKTWQLTRVVDESFHALDPKHTTKRRIYLPPKNFGLIRFADFDPDNFLGKGKK